MEKIILPEIFNYESQEKSIEKKFYLSTQDFSHMLYDFLFSSGVNLPEPFNSLIKHPSQTLDKNLKMTGYFFHLVTGQSYGDITLRVIIYTNGKINFNFQTSLDGHTWKFLNPKVLGKYHPVMAKCQKEMIEKGSLISSQEFSLLLEDIASIMKKNYKDLVT